MGASVEGQNALRHGKLTRISRLARYLVQRHGHVHVRWIDGSSAIGIEVGHAAETDLLLARARPPALGQVAAGRLPGCELGKHERPLRRRSAVVKPRLYAAMR